VVLVRLPGGNDFDIGRAAQSMMLAAAARGLGSCPITLHRRDRAREALAIPEGHEATWAIALGYPDEEAEPEQRRQAAARGLTGRRSLAELTHRGRFGGPTA
jgi:nitroreductase